MAGIHFTVDLRLEPSVPSRRTGWRAVFAVELGGDRYSTPAGFEAKFSGRDELAGGDSAVAVFWAWALPDPEVPLAIGARIRVSEGHETVAWGTVVGMTA